MRNYMAYIDYARDDRLGQLKKMKKGSRTRPGEFVTAAAFRP